MHAADRPVAFSWSFVPQCPICQDQNEEPATSLLGAAAGPASIEHGVVAARMPTASPKRTMSEDTEYNELHDDYLPILLKEEKFGRLEQSRPSSHTLESSENTK